MSPDAPPSSEPEWDSEDSAPQLGIQSVRSLILQNIEEYMSCRNNADKYHTLEGLITFCTDHIEDYEIRKHVKVELLREQLNPKTDFLNAYKNQSKTVPWSVIKENEYRKLLPFLRDVWFIVHKALVQQGLIPWQFPDPIRELQGRMLSQVLKEIDGATKKEIPQPEPSLVQEDRPSESEEESKGDKLAGLMKEQRRLLDENEDDDEDDVDESLLPPHPDEDDPIPVSDEEMEEAFATYKNYYLAKKKGRIND